MRADRLLHAIVQLEPRARQRSSVACASRSSAHLHDQRLVGANRAGEVAEPVLNLAEQRARLRQLRVERERALERVPRVGVAPFERRRHPGAEMQPRVLRIGRDRLAECLGRRVHSAGVQRVPRAALEQRRPRIDLRRQPGDRRRSSTAARQSMRVKGRRSIAVSIISQHAILALPTMSGPGTDSHRSGRDRGVETRQPQARSSRRSLAIWSPISASIRSKFSSSWPNSRTASTSPCRSTTCHRCARLRR